MSEDAAVYCPGRRRAVPVEIMDFSSLTAVQNEELKDCLENCQWFTTFGSGGIVFGHSGGEVLLVMAGWWQESQKFVVKDFDFDDRKVRKFMRGDSIVVMRRL